MRPRDAMPKVEIGLINSDLQLAAVEVVYQFVFVMGKGIPFYDACLYLDRQAPSFSPRLSRFVGAVLQLPHRLFNAVFLLLLTLALLRFLRLLLFDVLHEIRDDNGTIEAVPDDGSGDMAIA